MAGGGGGFLRINMFMNSFYHIIQGVNIIVKKHKCFRQCCSEFMEYRGFTGGLNDQCTLSYTHVNLMPVGSCVKPTSFTNKLLFI